MEFGAAYEDKTRYVIIAHISHPTTESQHRTAKVSCRGCVAHHIVYMYVPRARDIYYAAAPMSPKNDDLVA